ncbi:MAG TPA: translation elongation factor Ts [Candidatus Gracilibacteria bacterium]|nr:translation elongation factor Ts [Candidatus Gracilibacteria bacterium]
MTVNIEQIKELREMTGVSMSACKSALEEANGDMDKAIDVLRKKGEAKAVDRAARETHQGVVSMKAEGNKVAMAALLCETDFVARGEDFNSVVDLLAQKLLDGSLKPEDTEVPEVKELVLKAGENIRIGKMALVEGENVGTYIHTNKKIGVIISLEGGTSEIAKDVAMHAAATNPACVSPDEVPQEAVDKEKEIWREQLAKEGKPAEIVEKIMMGKEKKFREENALLKQQFVKNPEQTIEQVLAGATIKTFVRIAV